MGVRARKTMAAVIGVAAIAGCGVQATSGPPTGPAASGGTPGTVTCVTPKLSGASKTFRITEKDNGKSYCVVAGTSMFVFLHSSPSHLWSPIRASSAALQPRPSGVFSLALGVTGGYFLAARLGQASLTSHRAACHAGQKQCSPTAFRVTVLIRGTL